MRRDQRHQGHMRVWTYPRTLVPVDSDHLFLTLLQAVLFFHNIRKLSECSQTLLAAISTFCFAPKPSVSSKGREARHNHGDRARLCSHAYAGLAKSVALKFVPRQVPAGVTA